MKTKAGTYYQVKGKGPLSDAAKYGGKSDISYGFYSLVEHEVKKKTLVTVVPIPLLYSNGTDIGKIEYYLLNVLKLNVKKILIPVMRVNSIIKSGSSKVCITGKMGSRYLLNNRTELFFSANDLITIRKMSKLCEEFKKRNFALFSSEAETIFSCFTYETDRLIISPASSASSKAIELCNSELENLYVSLIRKSESSVLSLMTAAKNVGVFLNDSLTKDKFNSLYIWQKVFVLMQLIQFLTISSSSIDLSLIGGSKSIARTSMGANLTKDMSIIVESRTGFYSKVLWKGQ